MSPWCLVACYFLACSAVSFVLYCLRQNEVKLAEEDSYNQLRQRLSAYALMQWPCATEYHPPKNNISFVPSAMLICESQHKILLGILKKAEAKSAVMVVAVIFAIPALENMIWDFVKCSIFASALVAFSAGIFTSLLIFGVLGAVHLGQPHFRKLSKEKRVSILGRELQRALMHDMLRKEVVLRHTIWLGSVAFGCAASAVLLRIWQFG